MRRKLFAFLVVVCFMTSFVSHLSAKTLVLEGKINGSIAMRQTIEFAVNRGSVSTLSFRFALPSTFSSRTVKQSIEGFEANITPRPTTSRVETDRFGNRFQAVTWTDVSENIRVALEYNVNISSELTAMESNSSFPLGSLTSEESQYLKATDMVQFNSHEISALARQLTSGAKNQYEAVMAVTNWVADNIKYSFNPPHYDALYTLQTKSGNCQNFAHLSIALLRSLGIPARIVGGITLKESWKVPIDSKNSIVQSMGQGGHAWLEVFFPNLGWLPYDPQQSKQFTSSRHIKQSHGVDSKDINDTWKGAPYLPAYSESIDGRFTLDKVNLKMKKFDTAPRPYLLSNMISASSLSRTETSYEPAEPPARKTPPPATAKPVRKTEPPPLKKVPAPAEGTGAGPAETVVINNDEPLPDESELPKPKKIKKPLVVVRKQPPASVKPPLVVAEPVRRKLRPGTPLLFGNMTFPETVNLYNVKGDTGTRVFERETSEYVTSKYIFAQAFHIKDKMSLERISLAMCKFGGDGAIFIDLVKDKQGLPDIMQGIRSNLHYLDKISRKPGYYWVDFTFPPEGNKNPQLASGKYWIVLRASGEAIMNWFYIPGKPYGESDDTRSTAKGFQWEDILNYDFVFRVSGRSI